MPAVNKRSAANSHSSRRAIRRLNARKNNQSGTNAKPNATSAHLKVLTILCAFLKFDWNTRDWFRGNEPEQCRNTPIDVTSVGQRLPPWDTAEMHFLAKRSPRLSQRLLHKKTNSRAVLIARTHAC